MADANIPEGWYPDPSKDGQHRYWDGHKWGHDTKPSGSNETTANESAFRYSLENLPGASKSKGINEPEPASPQSVNKPPSFNKTPSSSSDSNQNPDRTARKSKKLLLAGAVIVSVAVIFLLGIFVSNPFSTKSNNEQVAVTRGPGEGDINVKPVIPLQSGSAPKDLVVQDLIVGTGAEANNGDNVTVQYVGVLFANGKEFDSSWGPSGPYVFDLGSGGVIAGFDQGVKGMKVGGRRRLIIPARLAYGASGSPPKIPANAALVFDVDLVRINAG